MGSHSSSHRSRYRRRRLKRTIKRLAVAGVSLLLLAGAVVSYVMLLGPGMGGSDPVSTVVVATQPLERTTALPPLELPGDDAPHVTATEWWYYSGHLFGEEGERYSFHATVFLRDGVVRHTVFHGSLTDHADGEHYTSEHRTAGIPSPVNVEGFDFRYADWRVMGFDREHAISMREDGFGMDLKLRDPYPAVLHRLEGSVTPGLLDFGEAGISYYYSRPRMRAEGTVILGDGSPVPVSGDVWFDHQWGDFEASRTGWNWFALHLDGGCDLMLYEAYDHAGSKELVAGTRSCEGESEPIASSALEIRPKGVWRSPQSGVRYPAWFEIDIPEGTLKVEPLRPDSEFDGRSSLFMVYWEGAVTVSGAAEGVGFLEMSGYDGVIDY